MTRALASADSAAEAGPVYLDYQATTPADPRVVAAMLPYFSEVFGNPHSRGHVYGVAAADAVEAARVDVARLIGADPREIVFTSGATESNNLAIKGAAGFRREGKNHVVTCATEHKCVLESCAALAAAGIRVTVLPVMGNGLIDLGCLESAIDDRTLLVSIMAVNNEIGVIQPLAAIGAVCRRRRVLFHSDAAQAVGKIPIDVNDMHVDLLSMSGHKIYGPKGIGALYVRRRPRVRLAAQMSGGGQERGLRSGTLPAPLCVGLGTACALASAEMAAESMRLRGLRDRLLAAITARIPDVIVNGDLDARISGNLNLAFPGADAEAVMAAMPDICVSTGSACTSAAVEPSYVLRALGLDANLAAASVRIGLGRFTTTTDVDRAAARLVAAVARERQTAAAQ